MKKILYWIPAVLMMGIIFAFSSKTADISGQSSMTISKYIYSVYERITGGVKTEEEKLDALETLDHIVRKGAHITEFAMLAAALAWPLRKSGLKGYRLAVASIGLAAIYAMTDEFHQTFVPGRSGELKDVGIDTVGALIGYSIFSLIRRIGKRIKKQAAINVTLSE